MTVEAPVIDVRRGNGWSHVWITRHRLVDDVEAALAEVGMAPHHVVYKLRAGNDCLVYRRTLTDDEVAVIEKAVRLARMQAAYPNP